MGWSKRQFIHQAYEEIGLASYVYDLSPEQEQSALRRLDAMMAQWNFKGIRVGYPLPGSPESSDIAVDTQVPDSANEAIYTNLAVRLGSAIGREISMELKQTAQDAYNVLLAIACQPVEKQMPGGFPLGAGNKPWRNNSPFTTQPEDSLAAGDDSEIEFT